MSIGSLQLVRTWGSCTQEFRQPTIQNVISRPQNRVTFFARGSGFLGSSTEILTGGSLLQDEHCLKLWHHVRAVPRRTTSHSPPSAYPSTGVSAVALAKPFYNIASASARAVGIILARAFDAIRNNSLAMQCGPAVALVAFSLWGVLPTLRFLRMIVNKEDSKWATSRTQHVGASYVQPIGIWIGIIIICRAFDPVVLSSEASQAIKGRFLNFVRSLATVLAFAFCTTRLTQQIQRAMMEGQDKQKSRNLGVQFVGSAVYTSVWVAAVCLFMELLGFSTQRWITAGGFGTVLLTLAGREIFTNFLSSIMIHATRPFIENEWIQTKIEGQEVSGTVEHVGWWSPTVVRGDDREAVHIPNHKFTVSVVRNLSQKTHWRIKTHFGVSHLDIGKITDIVADMRKVISKHPQVEQQRLHRRAFFDNIDPESQALLILVSCFVKTSHFEEYLRVKEIILLDMLRVISHHNARLATPIRSVQRIIDEGEARQNPFRDIATSAERKKPVYMIETNAVSVKDSSDEGGDLQKVDSAPKEVVKEVFSKDAGREGAGKATPLKSAHYGEKTDAKSKKKTKDKATVMPTGSVEAGAVKPGPLIPAETSAPASSPKPQLEGLDSMGLNSSDITLLKAAYEKPPANIPQGPVDLGPHVDIAQGEKVDSKASVEHQNPSKIESSPPGNGTGVENVEPVTSTPGESEKQSVTEQPLDDPWRKQSQVVTQPSVTVGGTALQKSEAGQIGARISEEKVQAGQGQGHGQGTQGPVPRLQSVEENLVLGVALDGPNRTLPLDDDIPSPAKQRELVASRNPGSATPPKDRRDQPSNPQSSPPGQFDSSRDRER